MRLQEAQDAARQGKHQFLSGVLHNLAKVLTCDDMTVPEMQMRALGLAPCGYCCSLFLSVTRPAVWELHSWRPFTFPMAVQVVRVREPWGGSQLKNRRTT